MKAAAYILARPLVVGVDCAAVVTGRKRGPKPAIVMKPVPIEVIVNAAIGHLDVHAEDFMSSRRRPEIVLARWIVYVLARELTMLSFPEIARSCGRPSHSSVVTGHAGMMRRLNRGDATARAAYEAVRAIVKKGGN